MYGARANKQDNEAKGTKTCYVSQLESQHQDDMDKAAGITLPVSNFSILIANVSRDGSVGLAISEDTYPGRDTYFLVDGKRYSGDGDHYVTVPTAPLLNDAVVKYTYNDWPYGADHSNEDVLAGFKAAYDECMAFLKG